MPQEQLLVLLQLLHHLEVKQLQHFLGFCFWNAGFFLLNTFINLAAGAGLTGSKMARRTGSVDEFEFKAIGENHNQGVSFLAPIFQFLGNDYILAEGSLLSSNLDNCFSS